uniref:G_PROTEIN_RECEP_F1_2 domain-containing protein n=1 Tax=Steinernema glaseri TaxID=37863 RepID=A0A1I8ALK5_9BILA
MDKRILTMQKEILKNLLIITGFSVLVGCIPAVIYVLFAFHGNWPYAQVIVLISKLPPLNHGTFYAVFILYLFKPCRKAVVKMLMDLKSILIKALPICWSSNSTDTVVMSAINVN